MASRLYQVSGRGGGKEEGGEECGRKILICINDPSPSLSSSCAHSSRVQLLGTGADSLSLPDPFRERAGHHVGGAGTGAAHSDQLLYCLPGDRGSVGRGGRDALWSVYPGKCTL